MCGQAGALIADRTVPLETVALKRGQDRRCCPGLFAWRVDILDPDEPLTAFLTRLQAAGNGSEQRAEMQRARGRWRKPADVLGWFSHWPGGRAAKPPNGPLAVTVIPVAELTFREFATFLSLKAQRRYGASLEPFHADFLTSFVTKAIAAILNAHERRVDFA